MIVATISDAIDSYLESGRTWSLAILAIVAILLVVWAIVGRASLGKLIGIGVTVALAFVIALYPQDLASKVKEDFDTRSGSLAPLVVPAPDRAVAA